MKRLFFFIIGSIVDCLTALTIVALLFILAMAVVHAVDFLSTF